MRWLLVLAIIAGCAYPQTQMEVKMGPGEQIDADFTAAVERGDFAEAERVADRWLALAVRSGTMVNMVAAHETLLWLRWSEGDSARALAENDAMATFAARAQGEPRRASWAHYWWTRTWLLADAGRTAEAADACNELERDIRSDEDRAGLKVLRAWVALAGGDSAAAEKALAGVNLDADDDSTDLYVLIRLRQAQHDEAAAERLRQRLRGGARTWMRGLVRLKLHLRAGAA
jgi:hypothetical protein